MKKILFGVLVAMMSFGSVSQLMAEDCLLCGSGSTNGCQQCRGTDRKACAAKGCKVSGTASCSTAANVKVCKADKPQTDFTFLTPQQSKVVLR